ncbi:Hypothetical_protein [Hexamita inflata]|uniref:Hypothetical_protein n=1 Tax=Hexamita inflata TaxID=28002 RepID=A0AA86RBD5_9EUKA|nr:Hypothetical protein HINF_LOCUS58466 [Hexamita inflata]
MTQFLTQPINLQIKPNLRSKQVPYEYAPPKDSKSYTTQQNQEDITQNSFITDIKRSESAKIILKCKSTGKATVKEPMKLLENIIVCKKPETVKPTFRRPTKDRWEQIQHPKPKTEQQILNQIKQDAQDLLPLYLLPFQNIEKNNVSNFLLQRRQERYKECEKILIKGDLLEQDQTFVPSAISQQTVNMADEVSQFVQRFRQ